VSTAFLHYKMLVKSVAFICTEENVESKNIGLKLFF
jgi:hypothetical protein